MSLRQMRMENQTVTHLNDTSIILITKDEPHGISKETRLLLQDKPMQDQPLSSTEKTFPQRLTWERHIQYGKLQNVLLGALISQS